MLVMLPAPSATTTQTIAIVGGNNGVGRSIAADPISPTRSNGAYQHRRRTEEISDSDDDDDGDNAIEGKYYYSSETKRTKENSGGVAGSYAYTYASAGSLTGDLFEKFRKDGTVVATCDTEFVNVYRVMNRQEQSIFCDTFTSVFNKAFTFDPYKVELETCTVLNQEFTLFDEEDGEELWRESVIPPKNWTNATVASPNATNTTNYELPTADEERRQLGKKNKKGINKSKSKSKGTCNSKCIEEDLEKEFLNGRRDRRRRLPETTEETYRAREMEHFCRVLLLKLSFTSYEAFSGMTALTLNCGNYTSVACDLPWL